MHIIWPNALMLLSGSWSFAQSSCMGYLSPWESCFSTYRVHSARQYRRSVSRPPKAWLAAQALNIASNREVARVIRGAQFPFVVAPRRVNEVQRWRVRHRSIGSRKVSCALAGIFSTISHALTEPTAKPREVITEKAPKAMIVQRIQTGEAVVVHFLIYRCRSIQGRSGGLSSHRPLKSLRKTRSIWSLCVGGVQLRDQEVLLLQERLRLQVDGRIGSSNLLMSLLRE